MLNVFPSEKRSSFQLEGSFSIKKTTFHAIFIFKDKMKKMLHSNLVYKFKCNICNDIYCGKTKRHFKVEACGHLGITPLTGKNVKSPNERAVFDRIIHKGHNASFDDFEILVKECDEFKLLLRDSLYYLIIYLWIDMLSSSF